MVVVVAWGLRLYLLALCAQIVRLLRRPSPVATPLPAGRMSVTVQAVVCDETAAIPGLIQALAGLDMPDDGLALQVLDDSATRDAQRLLEDAVAIAPVPIRVLRRGSRAGAKAGNLAHGLGQAGGEGIAVLDADARPGRGMVRRLAGVLDADPGCALAQGVPSFVNAGHDGMTDAAAILFGALMLVEQPLASAEGRALHFNGSGGVWRRTAVEQAGGWVGLAEDYDLSVRVQALGWRLRTEPGVVIGVELPWTMADLRRQQLRWVEGKVDTLRRLAPDLLVREGPATLALFSATFARAIHPLLLVTTVALPWSSTPPMARLFDIALAAALVAAVRALVVRTGGGRAVSGARYPGVPTLGALRALTLMIGLSWVGTVGWLRGLTGLSAGFTPTAKGGADRRGAPDAWVEVALGVWSVAWAGQAARSGDLASASAAGWLAAGWLWVGAASVTRR